jgi:hypothetical protein
MTLEDTGLGPGAAAVDVVPITPSKRTLKTTIKILVLTTFSLP